MPHKEGLETIDRTCAEPPITQTQMVGAEPRNSLIEDGGGLPLTQFGAVLTRAPRLEDVGLEGVRAYLRQAGCNGEQVRNYCDQIGQAANPEAGQFGQKLSQASLLLKLAEESELFRTPGGKAHARVRLNGVHETFAVRSADYKSYLYRLYYDAYDKAPGAQAVNDAIAVLEARAKYDGPEYEVHCRIAHVDGKIYLDLANRNRDVVEVTPNNWSVKRDVPAHFKRSKGMLGLPVPVGGGSLMRELARFVNAKRNDLILVIAYLLSWFLPNGGMPILQLKGEQGSAKTTTSRAIRTIGDPNEAPARANPKDERDLVVSLSNSFIACFDNLSFLPDWLSDVFCRVSTGQAFAARTLYSDDEESIFTFKRPIILNGIEELSTRGDLVDRSIIIDLPRIPDSQRKTEKEFWAAFQDAHPIILGALLDAVAAALANFDLVEPNGLPRMSDFARWVIAAEQYLGWPEGTFLEAYSHNRREGEMVALEASPVAAAIQRFVRSTWTGTAAELLQEITDTATPVEMKHPAWPKGPHGLGNAIRRLAPNLRTASIDVQCWKSGQRFMKLSRTGSPGTGTGALRKGAPDVPGASLFS